mgnify:CR=1 FL=1
MCRTMAHNEIDKEDAAVFSLFGLGAASSVGIADVQLFGYAFSDPMPFVDVGSATVATLVSLLCFGWIWITNDPDIDKLDDVYRYMVLGTAALIVAVPMVTQLHTFITSNDAIALAAVMVQSAGAVAVSYKA